MTTQPALSAETAEGGFIADRENRRTRSAEDRPKARARGRVGQERVNWSTTVILILCAVTVLLPLYVTISMSLKTSGQAVDGNAFSLPAPFSFDGFVQA